MSIVANNINIYSHQVLTSKWRNRAKGSSCPARQQHSLQPTIFAGLSSLGFSRLKGGLKGMNATHKRSTCKVQLHNASGLVGGSATSRNAVPANAAKLSSLGKEKRLTKAFAVASPPPPTEPFETFPSFVEEVHIDPHALPPFPPLFKEKFDGLPLSSHGDAASEEYITRAHELAVSWLPSDVRTRLENFLDDENGPSVLVVRGLPVDSNPPLTPYKVGNMSAKPGKTMSEAWVLAVARIIGQPVTYESLVKRGMAGGLVCDLTPNPDSMDKVAFDGCKKVLDLHRDFAVTPEKIVADALLLIGVRGDPREEAKTTVCDFRALLAATSPADVSILRSEPMRWDGGAATNSNFRIEGKLLVNGPDSNPIVNVFEEDILPTGAASLNGSPQLLEAYRRLKQTARRLAVGVWLDAGDVLIVNNRRAAHGRTAYTAVFDGSDRWVQRVYAKRELVGAPGEPPSRVLRFGA